MIDYPASWSTQLIVAHKRHLAAVEELNRVKDEVLQPAMDAYNAAEAEMKRLHQEFLDAY